MHRQHFAAPAEVDIPLPSGARRRCGLSAAFTLLEILITVAVVGLLAAIALPVYRFFVPNAATVVNLADLKVINQGLEIYKFQNPTSPLLTGSNDTAQHTALLTAIQGMAESPFKYLAFDPTKITSTGSGQAFRFTGYISGSAAMVTGSGGSGSGSGSGTLTASQVVLNGLGFTTLTGGGSNALASMVTAGLPSGSRVVVGVAGQQSVYELADTTGPQTVPTLVMPNDYGAGNQRMWLQRFWGGTLQTTNYLSEYFGNPGAQSAIQTNLGLGNMSQQNSGNVTINGGTIVLPAGGFSLGSQIVSTVSLLQLSGKIGAGLLSSTTFTLDGSTIGAGFTLAGARNYSLISTSAAAPLGAGYLVLADATAGAYRMAIDSTGRVAFGGTAPYAPTAWLTFRGDGVSPIMDAQLANGTSAFSLDKLGIPTFGALAGTAGTLQVDAAGKVSVGAGGSSGNWVLKDGDTMAGDLTVTHATGVNGPKVRLDATVVGSGGAVYDLKSTTAADAEGAGRFVLSRNGVVRFAINADGSTTVVSGLKLPFLGAGQLSVDASGTVYSSAQSGPKLRAQEFNSTGTFTPSASLLAAGGWVDVFLVGGGGGGARGSSGGGGGGGAVISKRVQITGPVTITVGTGGIGGTSGVGGTGGTSTFGSLITAYGGGGGGNTAVIPCGGGGGASGSRAGGGGGAGGPGGDGSGEPTGPGGPGLQSGAGGRYSRPMYRGDAYTVAYTGTSGNGGIGINGFGGGGGGGGYSYTPSGGSTDYITYGAASSGGGIGSTQGAGLAGQPNTGGGGGGGGGYWYVEPDYQVYNGAGYGGAGGSGYCLVSWVE